MKRTLCVLLLLVLMLSVTVNGAKAEEKSFHIGISIPVLTNPYWQSWTEYAKGACDQLGITYTVTDGNNDDTTQFNQVQSLCGSGIDALILVPNTVGIGESLIELCEESNVPVLCSGRSPGFAPADWDGDMYIANIMLDHVERGYKIAQSLYDQGARLFVALGGPSGASNANDRAKGLIRFISEHSDTQLLQEIRDCEVREHGAIQAENLLSTYPGPGFDAIWCYNDEVAMGALESLMNYGFNGKILLGGVDLNADAIQQIIDGNYHYSNAANIYSIPLLSVTILYDYLNGITPEETLIMKTFIEVTSNNAQEYYDKYIANPPTIDLKDFSRYHGADWEKCLSLN